MGSRSFRKALLDLSWTPSPKLPPTFLLPWRAQLHQSTHPTQHQNPRLETPPQSLQPSPPPSLESPPTKPVPTSSISIPSSLSKPLVLSKSLQHLLPHLTAQKPHHITAHIHRFPYLLTEGDTLRLPFHMHGVSPGDILRLNRASLLGSRTYTLKAGTDSTENYDGKRTGEPNYIDERLFECRARVVAVENGPMVVEIKTKRRLRKKKHVRSKHRYTVLRVMQIRIKGLEELQSGRDQLILQ